MDFHDTSFFQSGGGSLPTPDEVLELNHLVVGGGRGTVRFEHLNLVVKAGAADYLRLEEAQTLRAMWKAFPAGEVPVPEIFGWRTVGGQNFIYMSLIPGETLRDAWDSLSHTERLSIRDQLSKVVGKLRTISPPTTDWVIGMLATIHTPPST